MNNLRPTKDFFITFFGLLLIIVVHAVIFLGAVNHDNATRAELRNECAQIGGRWTYAITSSNRKEQVCTKDGRLLLTTK